MFIDRARECRCNSVRAKARLRFPRVTGDEIQHVGEARRRGNVRQQQMAGSGATRLIEQAGTIAVHDHHRRSQIGSADVETRDHSLVGAHCPSWENRGQSGVCRSTQRTAIDVEASGDEFEATEEEARLLRLAGEAQGLVDHHHVAP